jgi:Ca2+-binding RTX toxin-like protein
MATVKTQTGTAGADIFTGDFTWDRTANDNDTWISNKSVDLSKDITGVVSSSRVDDMVLLSSWVYRNNDSLYSSLWVENGGIYEVVTTSDSLANPASPDYYGAVVRNVVDNTYIIVHRGADTDNDLYGIDGFYQDPVTGEYYTEWPSRQIIDAKRLTDVAYQIAESNPDAAIYQTGHSLGGRLASIASKNGRADAVFTFNTAWQQSGEYRPNMHNFRIADDWTTNIGLEQNLLEGNVYEIQPLDTSLNIYERHNPVLFTQQAGFSANLIENVTLSSGSASALYAVGNYLNNRLTGNQYANWLEGREGNDTLSGGAGNDTMDGGAGNDLVQGGSGNDNLGGSWGNDTLDGGTGADIMAGGVANDSYVVDNLNDLVQEYANEGHDTVRSSISYQLTDNVENLVLTGSAGTQGYGNDLDNHLTGNSGSNKLVGWDGNDMLDGKGGADEMLGGQGNDTYVVDNLNDLTIESWDDGGFDTVLSSVTRTLNDFIENLTLTGSSSINGTGNWGNNGLQGNTGNNLLRGLDGHDYLNGGRGTDRLEGGHGDDTYHFTKQDGKDTVFDAAGVDDWVTLSEQKSNVSLAFKDGDLLLRYDNSTNDVLTLKAQTTADNRVELIQAADGSTLDVNAVIALMTTYTSLPGANVSGGLNFTNADLQMRLDALWVNPS